MARHRRPRARGIVGARTASLVTAGALAGGAAIAATTLPWPHTAALPQPRAPQDDRPGAPSRPAPPDHDGSSPPSPAVPVVAAPRDPTPSAVPALARATTRWRAQDQSFRVPSSNASAHATPTIEHGEVAFHLAPGVRRCEAEPALPALEEGGEHLVSCSVRLDHATAAGHHVFLRWDNDGPGSAPVDLRVRDGRLVLHGGDGHPSGTRTFTRDLGHAPAGEWTHLAVRVRFSANHEKGSVSVRRDGRTVVADHHPSGGTLYPGQQSYLKAGLRRDSATSHTADVRLRDWHVSGVRHGESRSSGHAQHSEQHSPASTAHDGAGGGRDSGAGHDRS
jgi:hypothetical protein